MASTKVNKKFAIYLAAGLAGITVAGGGLAYFFVLGNASRLASQGDAALARDNLAAADKFYSKAVNKEQSNPEYLRKWIAVMERMTPDTENAFTSKFSSDYLPARRQLAIALRTDLVEHERYLRMLMDIGAGGQVPVAVANSIENIRGGGDASGIEGAEGLRKYRGTMLLTQYLQAANIRDEEINQAREDFEAALKADPSDGEAAVGLSTWWSRRSTERLGRQDRAGAEEALASSRKVLNDFLASNPNNARALIARVYWTAEDRQQELLAVNDLAQRRAGLDQLRTELESQVAAATAALRAVPAERLETDVIGMLQAVERTYLTGPQRHAGSESLYKAVLEKTPEHMDALARLAELYGDLSRPDDALALLEKLASIPQKPMGVEGLRQYEYRRQARFNQAINAMRKWVQSSDPGEKAKWLTEAKKYREALSPLMIDSDNTRLIFVDAHLEFAQGNNARSQRMLFDYNRRTNNSNLDAQWLLAEVSLRLNEEGLAEQALTQIVTQQPSNLTAILKLADLKIRMRKYEDALPLVDRAVRLDPNNEQVAKTQQLLEMQVSGRGNVQDPVSRAILESDKLERDGDANAAYELLTKTLRENPGHPTLTQIVASRMSLRGDREGAIKIVDEALEKNPDFRPLRQTRVALTETDPTQVRLILIDQSDRSDLDKALIKYEVLRQTDRADEARAELEKARALAPDNNVLLEYDFIDALQSKDWAKGERLAGEAARRDLDRLDGLTFRARINAAKGNLVEAVRELESARARDTFGVEASRFLGEMLVRVGRPTDAVSAFRQALSKRPDDLSSTMALISLLDQLDRGPEALDEARKAERYHSGDLRFADMWLVLESRFGDRERALKTREKQIQEQPNNRDVQMSLASLYLDLKRFPQSRELINRIRQQHDGLDAIVLDAKWHGDQADLRGSRKVFDDALAAARATPAKNPPVPDLLMAMGGFMERNEQTDLAVQSYKEAQAIQDAKTLPADKALADMYQRLGRLAESADLYEKVVNAGADTDDKNYAKRLVDVLLRMRRGAEAEKYLAGMGSEATADATMLMQWSDAARLRGDEKRAAALLDQAVAKFPRDPMVYFRRAQANLAYRDLRVEVMKDLDTAIELRPQLWQARRARAMMHVQDGDVDKAVRDLREAVRFNPTQDELRVALLRELLLSGRDTDAIEVADEVIRKRPSDLALLVNTGDLFREAGRDDRALQYYRDAYKLSSQLFVVIPYLSLLQGGKNPNLAEADTVLRTLGNQVVGSHPALLMSRAKQFLKRNRPDEGLRDVIAALRVIGDNNPGMIMGWFNDLKGTLTRPEDLPAVLDAVDKEKLAPGWTTFFRAGLKIESRNPPAVQAEGVATLEEMARRTDLPDPLVWQASAALQAKYYQQKDCSNGLRVVRSTVERFPDDSFMLNNLAFMIVHCGGDPKEAVPIAEKAVLKALERNQDAAGVRDTLGWVYLRNGELDKAEVELVRAIGLAGGQPVRQTIVAHLAEMEIARAALAKREGKPAVVEAKLAQAEGLIGDAEKANATYSAPIPGLKDKLDELKASIAELRKK
ncbi:MAG: tetratricopeptide repeat protein [Phycisphaeraceae bacterium]|nr:MAG: tetratricopeptide repeat protein [Phycisphaeraceae bacterium]